MGIKEKRGRKGERKEGRNGEKGKEEKGRRSCAATRGFYKSATMLIVQELYTVTNAVVQM